MDPNIQNSPESENPQQSSTAEVQSINPQKITPSHNSPKLIIIVGLILLLLISGGGLWYLQTTHKNSTTPTISTNAKEIKSEPTLSKDKAPDLTSIVNKITSSDPKIQQQALAPGGSPVPNQPLYVLPVGSTLKLEPNTWETTGLDATGAPASGNSKAILTYPGKPSEEIVMQVIKLKGTWYIFDTIMPSITP